MQFKKKKKLILYILDILPCSSSNDTTNFKCYCKKKYIGVKGGRTEEVEEEGRWRVWEENTQRASKEATWWVVHGL